MHEELRSLCPCCVSVNRRLRPHCTQRAKFSPSLNRYPLFWKDYYVFAEFGHCHLSSKFSLVIKELSHLSFMQGPFIQNILGLLKRALNICCNQSHHCSLVESLSAQGLGFLCSFPVVQTSSPHSFIRGS